MFTEHSSPYYKPSGRAPITSLFMMLVVGLLAAMVLSFPYVLAVRYCPSAYLCGILTVCYGFFLGWLLNKLSYTGKIRAPGKVSFIALITSISAVWFSWVFFVASTFSGENAPLVDLYRLTLNPTNLLDGMKAVLEHGTWSFGHGSGDKEPVKGIILAVVWAGEALTLIGFTLFCSRSNAKKPFSEALNCWATEEKLPVKLPFQADVATTKAALESGDLSSVLKVDPAPVNPFSKIELHAADGDPDCHFLTLVNTNTVTDKKGNAQQKTAKVVEHLRITPEVHQQLRAKFGAATV